MQSLSSLFSLNMKGVSEMSFDVLMILDKTDNKSLLELPQENMKYMTDFKGKEPTLP